MRGKIISFRFFTLGSLVLLCLLSVNAFGDNEQKEEPAFDLGTWRLFICDCLSIYDFGAAKCVFPRAILCTFALKSMPTIHREADADRIGGQNPNSEESEDSPSV